jgi:hypothetical protein
MTSKIQNKKSAATRAVNLITGMKSKFPNGKQTLLVGNETITVDDAIGNLQAIVDNRGAVTTARAAAKAQVAAENAKMPPLLAFMSALVKVIRASFGTDASALALFDLDAPKARTPMTAEEKAVAVAKREATREARGTTSPKKRSKVHGSVNATLVVTPAASTAPVPATPAPANPEPPAPAAAAPVTPPKA